MQLWSFHIFYLLLLAVLKIDCDAKEICFRKFHTIQNGSFFQRIEVPSLLRCVEQCIDNIEHCKAALFIPEENKNKSFCQLYDTNSNSSDNGITLDNSLNSTSTVFEILDKCPATNASTNSGNNLMEMIKLELRQKLESWSDPELSPLLPQDAQRFRNDESTRKSKISNDRKKLGREAHFLSQNDRYGWSNNVAERSRNANYEPVRPVIDGLVPLDQNGFNPSSSLNKLLPHANHYPSTLSQISNTNNNYLPRQGYSFTNNEIPLLSPIKPVVVNHGRQGIIYSSCQGRNCYAPSLAYLQKSSYNWPCPIYPSPCQPKIPNSCVTRCPQVDTTSPKTALFNEEWSESHINKQQQFNKPEPESVSSSPSIPIQSTENMIISWSEWSPQTACSVTCGIGITMRKRFCSVDGQCKGESVKEELCNSGPCPEWKPWSEWTECSRSCGGGERSRSRICSVSKQCDGPSVSIEACNVENCGQWSAWGSWEECSVTCGIGQQIRRRQCVGGDSCIGDSIEKKICKEALCPSWSTWEPWSTCSVSCGNGQRHRTRICYGSNNCIGDAEEHEVCEMNSCPQWTDWSSWTQCTETCGTKGSKLRVRTCMRNNLISSLCDGAAQDQMACRDLPECPSWISWSSWSICSVTCGHGQENRQRSCLPTNMKCAGADREFRFCQESVCPYWDEWSSWSTCSVTCGFGTRERRRQCMEDDVIKTVIKEGFSLGDVTNTSQLSNNTLTSTVPSIDENNSVVKFLRDNSSCIGNSVDREQCNAGLCCQLTEWTTWTTCSVTCGGGIRERHRTCSSQIDRSRIYELNRSPNYSKVIRKHVPVEPIMRHRLGPATVGHYGRQGLQRIIPVKFENLMRIRRQATNVHNFGLFEQDDFVRKDESLCRCDGELREVDSCAENPCSEISNAPICGWSHWTEWCGCTGSCNQGSQIRTRYCTDNIPASEHTSNSNTERTHCILPECSMGQESRQLSTIKQNTESRPYSTQTNSYILPQYNCHQIIPIVKRGTNMDCLWSSWNFDNSCRTDIKMRTRSCFGFSTKAKCDCDGKLVEQIECFCSQMKINESVTPPSRGAGISEERMTAYRSSCSWLQWGRWSACSETCGTGKTVRKRYCPCRSCNFGESIEIQSCELKSC
ncbi:Thrombospondin type 1 domain family protein [Acanthocheilonema viteae]